MALLEVKNLCKKYGDETILDDINFELKEGEVLSIIGSSGNGKTTLLRCLNYLSQINGGEVLFNGEVILNEEISKNRDSKDVLKYRSHFGLVFQQFNLFPQYTAFDNIKLPYIIREKNNKKKGLPYVEEEVIDAEVLELLKKVGLESKKDFYPCELSGGQQQRIAIARSMALKPDILCFDEPTSALDPELTNEVLKVIKELKEQFKITMIIVTHEMEFARNISDKVIHLSKRTIASMGTPTEVFENSTNEDTIEFIKSYQSLRS